MKTVNNIPPAEADVTYREFEKTLARLDPNYYYFILFYGNPTQTAESWCPVCVTTVREFVRFADTCNEKVRFLTIPIGTREELMKNNPFVTNFPHLYSVPTLVVTRIVEHKGKKFDMRMAKVLEPTLEDFKHFAKKYGLRSS